MNIDDIGVKIIPARTTSTAALASISVPLDIGDRKTRVNIHGFRVIYDRFGKRSFKVFPPQIERPSRKSFNIFFIEDALTWALVEGHIVAAYERVMKQEFA
jgi:hypothetical protein